MSTDDKYGELRRLDEIVNRIAAERGLPWDKRPFDEIPEAERKGMADALREWSALSAVAAQEGLIPTSYGSAAVTPSLSSARHPIFVTEHHLNEVRKCFERLVKKYAGADFRNTNTEAGCIWNDAVNLANGINATHSASGPTNGGTCAKCQRSFTSEDYCPICSNPSEGQWQMLRKDERGT